MIQHVTRDIPPSRVADCVAFYSLLGFAPIDVPPGLEGRAVWLAGGGAAGAGGGVAGAGGGAGADLHLMLVEGAGRATGHVAFVVEPYDETVARLREAGFEVEPRREHWGSPRSYVRDPAGNLVELMARPPG